MGKTHFDALEWIISNGIGLTETEVKEVLMSGIISDVTRVNIGSILIYFFNAQIITSESNKIKVTNIGISQYNQEKERRDFDKSVQQAQRDLNLSQINTNFYVKCTSIAMTFFTFGLLLIAWLDFKKEKTEPYLQQEQNTLQTVPPKTTYPNDAKSVKVQTLSDSL